MAEGEKAFRFSPVYPDMDIISPKDLYKNSQVCFYAVDMKKKDFNLLDGEKAGLVNLDISEAEKHGTLNHTASVFNIDNDTITPGLDTPGPRVVNFADILKYNYAPLGSTLRTILDVVGEAIGNPSEIEFAVDLTKDKDGNATFYLLQIKPLIGSGAGYDIDPESIDINDLLLKSEKSMGNGILNNISDIVYLEPQKFDNLRTIEMVEEIEKINENLMNENRNYILIGPGRWGTRDRFLGIPVVWPQISYAKVIVEIGLPDFYLDASLGSHFFHNVTALNIGYFSINEGLDDGIMKWEKLNDQEIVGQGQFFRHIRFDKPLMVRMDGKKGLAVITLNQ